MTVIGVQILKNTWKPSAWVGESRDEAQKCLLVMQTLVLPVAKCRGLVILVTKDRACEVLTNPTLSNPLCMWRLTMREKRRTNHDGWEQRQSS
jgi:hypothetical protein